MNQDNWLLSDPIHRLNYSINDPIWRSEKNGLLDIHFQAKINAVPDSGRQGLWKYADMIPVFNPGSVVSFGEGCTPVNEIEINGNNHLLKLEYIFPTGSYKDRGATVLVSKIKELGIRKIVEDSSGNAGCAIAAYAAAAGIECEILVSKNTSPAKIQQLEAYGATVTKIEGNRQAVADAALVRAEQTYYASHSWNPFFFQGTKTFAYEIAEQCGENLPDEILLPVGNGTLLIGAWIGFSELHRNGLIASIPRLSAVQAENCAPLINGHKSFQPTMAEGIAVQNPVRKNQILHCILSTGGSLISVTEDEIRNAFNDAASMGYYIEKTSAAGWAALQNVSKKGRILLALTGHGLKNQ